MKVISGGVCCAQSRPRGRMATVIDKAHSASLEIRTLVAIRAFALNSRLGVKIAVRVMPPAN